MKRKIINNRYCDNVIIKNDREYYLEKIWRLKKNDYSKDSKGNNFPYPKINKLYWGNKKDVIEKLKSLNNQSYEEYKTKNACLICGTIDITTKRYTLNNISWDDSLLHYIEDHNIEPSIQFKEFIFSKNVNNKINILHRHNNIYLKHVIDNNKEYVKIERNQLLILDSLMIHGGITKKYIDNDTFRYSEHAGFLDFEGTTLNKIIVSGKTNRIDDDDDDIFFPSDIDDEMLDYEYIFHTHPPTPKAGGRVTEGILYEFPSVGDIYHFIEHHNKGKVIGSLVFTPEGLYNIRKYNNDNNSINIDEDKLFKNYEKTFNLIQKKAISIYKTKFDTNFFYSFISQDATHINKLNDTLNEFNINIDYYPRKKDNAGKWFIDTLFLVFRKKN